MEEWFSYLNISVRCRLDALVCLMNLYGTGRYDIDPHEPAVPVEGR